MEQPGVKEQSPDQPGDPKQTAAIAPSPESPTKTTLSPQAGAGTCASCGTEGASNPNGSETVTPSYVYALGRVEARFPRLAVEKEFAQATGRADTARLTDRQALHAVLSQRQNRYLLHQLCWVLTIEGLETYILVPRNPADFDLLVEALRPAPRAIPSYHPSHG